MNSTTRFRIQPMFQLPQATEVLISHRTMSSNQEQQRIIQLENAIRCACDYLRVNAPGRALEVLELNMR